MLEWGKGLRDTLRRVHQLGIFHHDLKPDNLIFTSDGVLKVGDFGVAHRMAGTIRYLAPEEAHGGVGSADARVDVYALRITLLKLLANHNPFDGVPGSGAGHLSMEFAPKTFRIRVWGGDEGSA